MESFRQHQLHAGPSTQMVNGKTLVRGRQFDAPSSWMGNDNPDRRHSAMSLHKKKPGIGGQVAGGTRPRPRPRRREREESPPKPTAEQLVDKWKKVSQPVDDDSDGDDESALRLAFSRTSQTNVRGKTKSAAPGYSGTVEKLKLFVSPESRTTTLPSTRYTSYAISREKTQTQTDSEPEYLLVSQDGTQVSSSAPRRDLLLEVTIGTGDGASIGGSEPSSAERESFKKPKATTGRQYTAVPASGAASRRYARDQSIGYSSDDMGGRRDDSFVIRVDEREDRGRGSGSEDVVEVQKGKGKGKAAVKGDGKGKPKRVEEKRKVVKTTAKGQPNAMTNLTKQTDTTTKRKDPPPAQKPRPPPPPSPKKPTKQAKVRPKPKRVTLYDESDSDSPTDASTTPRPIRTKPRVPTQPKTSARREKTPPPLPTRGSKRKRTIQSDESSEDELARTPIRRKGLDRTPVKRPADKGKAKEPANGKDTANGKKKTRAPSPNFPSPIRAPVRVDEALLSSPPPPPMEEPQIKYRVNAAGEQEEIVFGPNGAELLPFTECAFSDCPTLQLPPEKIPQLIARKIAEDKCPYCDNFLPSMMSTSLEALFAKLQSTRPSGSVDNDWTRTIEFCERHQAESHVFPLGLHAGYPAEMNFTELRKRVKKMKPDVKRMLKRPKDSPFYLFAQRDLERQGRRKWASTESRNDEQRKNRLLPGYFGPLGKMTIANVLRGMLRSDRFARLVTPKAIDPLMAEEYIEHVLVLEVALLLITEDMVQTNEDNEPYTEKEKRARALQILKESREYGRLRFGIGSEHLAEDDLGNGATQMVIADVRGLNDDSEEESEEEEASSSEDAEEEQDTTEGAASYGFAMDDSSQGRSNGASPLAIEDDDDEIRLSSNPEILPIDTSPVQSIATRRSQSPEAIIVDQPTPSRNTISQIDKSIVPVTIDDDADDDFDDGAISIDEQELIDATNRVEESHFQQQKRQKNAHSNGKARAPPKFADVVNITSPDRPGSAAAGTSNGAASRRTSGPDSGKSQHPVVHEIDDDDQMADYLGSHSNLITRTQARQTPQSHRNAGASSSANRTGNTGSGGGPSRFSNGQSQAQRPTAGRWPNETNNSPYHYTHTAQGARQIGLQRPPGAQGPRTAGPSSAGGTNNGRRAAEPRRGGQSGGNLFIQSKRNQALIHRDETRDVYGAILRKE